MISRQGSPDVTSTRPRTPFAPSAAARAASVVAAHCRWLSNTFRTSGV